MQDTFLSMIDYGDIIYAPAASSTLRCQDSAYHRSLRFISNSLPHTHRCVLYNLVPWSSLRLRRQLHWYIFIYKAILSSLLLFCTLIMEKNLPKQCSLMIFSRSNKKLCNCRVQLLFLTGLFFLDVCDASDVLRVPFYNSLKKVTSCISSSASTVSYQQTPPGR